MIRSIQAALLSITVMTFTNCTQHRVENEEKPPASAHAHIEPEKATRQVTLDEKNDPVCGMPVASFLKDTTLYAQKIYGFCSDECKKMFVDNPTAYIKPKTK